MQERGNPMNQFFSALDDRQSRIHSVSLLLIILAGFLLRWYSLYVGHAYTFFTIKDEITALKYAFGFMGGDPHTYYLGSPALNQGNIPGPLWAMFVAALYTLGGHSISGAIFLMVVLNTFVIYLVYRLAGQMMSARYALFSALFYSLAPWPIYYSAGLYNPMVLAFLGSLLYLALWQTLTHENSRMIFWVMLLAAAIPQFHMIGIFYYPAILWLLLLNPYRFNTRWLVAGITAGVLLYVPYFIGEMTHHWQNLHNVLQRTDQFSFGALKIITIPLGMLTNHPGEWPGYTTAELLEFANKWFGSYLILLIINIVSLILAIFFIAGFGKRLYLSLRASGISLKIASNQDRPYIFIGMLLLLPLLLYLLTGKAYATRYSILIFPILFLLPALFIAGIKKPVFKQSIIYALSVMFICNIYLVLSFYADQNHELTSSSRFIPAFYKLEDLRNALQHYAGKDKLVEVDTSHLLGKDNKYYDITTNAITNYIELYQGQQQAVTKTSKKIHFILVDARAKVPANATIVYQTNGLVAYTK